jgi:hypothetical protein
VADFAPYRDRENVASKINYGNDSSKSDSHHREFVHPPSCAFGELSTIAFGEADPLLAKRKVERVVLNALAKAGRGSAA